MEKIGGLKNDNEVLIFNSALETGIRSLIILEAAFPQQFDLTTIIWLDHLVVHTGDFGGPESLHPSIPQRSGELLVRRRIIENSLLLMRQLHLIAAIATDQGIFYAATENAYPTVELFRSKYILELRNRAVWLVENVCNLPHESLKEMISARMGRWSVEFQEVEKAGPQ
jgi:hypothetical protein